MAFRAKAEVEGLRELVLALDHLKNAVRNRILRKAVGDGARIIAKAAKQKAPVRSKADAPSNITPLKLLKKSIGSKVKVYRNSGKVVGIVGPRTGFKTQIGSRVRKGKKSKPGDPIYENPTNVAHLLELGTKRSRARPFLRPALDQSKEQVKTAMAAAIKAGIEKEAVKGAKQ